MSEPELFSYTEINDLSREGKLGERSKYSESGSHASDTKNPVRSNSTIVNPAHMAVSSFSVVVPAVISILAVASFALTIAVSPPEVSTSEWNVTDRSVAFQFSGEEADPPYFILIEDLETGETIASIESPGSPEMISFEHLVPESDYRILIENDYGAGMRELKEVQIRTAGTPMYQRGTLRVETHELDYASEELRLYLDLDDPGSYLQDIRIVLSDGTHQMEQTVMGDSNPIVVPLTEFERGYLTVSIYALSTYPTDGQRTVKTALYKVYY